MNWPGPGVVITGLGILAFQVYDRKRWNTRGCGGISTRHPLSVLTLASIVV